MPRYCIGAEKATVTYQFGNNKPGEITTEYPPVDVEINTVRVPIIDKSTWYEIRVKLARDVLANGIYEVEETTLSFQPTTLSSADRSLFLTQTNGAYTSIRGVRHPVQFLGTKYIGETGFPQICRQKIYDFFFSAHDRNGNKHVIRWYVTASQLAFTGNDSEGCLRRYALRSWELVPIASDRYEDKYQLTVTDSRNRKYKVLGKEEPTYSVDCHRCPKGTIECHSDEPPGYCCLPCPPVVSELRIMQSLVRKMQ